MWFHLNKKLKDPRKKFQAIYQLPLDQEAHHLFYVPLYSDPPYDVLFYAEDLKR
jgi:hypothetical protein